MTDYREIEKTCLKQSELFETLATDFLVYYCAEREGLDKLFTKKLGRYRSIIHKMPDNWVPWLMSQYAAFHLFRQDGYARQYMNLHKIKSRSSAEQAFLSFQIENPWRYSFFSIKSKPARNFFEMLDVLTNEKFLLHSPGLAKSLEKTGPMQMYYFLLAFNGKCWQTYGPHAHFRGIIPADLLFFGRQLDAEVTSMNQIPDLIEQDPLPWAMLWRSGEIPLTYHKHNMLMMNCSEYHREDFNPDEYMEYFKIERKPPLYKMSLKHWDNFPHFSTCFYHKKKNQLILSALTDRGYAKLIEHFGKKGFALPANHEHRVTPNMLQTANEVLGRDIKFNPYEKSFSEPVKKEHSDELDKINKFVSYLTDAHNAGKEANIDEFASLAGIDTGNAYNITEKVMKILDRMPIKK